MAASVIVTVVSIVTAASSKILADEFKAWRPRITDGLVGFAVRRLPEQQRQRYHEEWLSFIHETPGDIGKLIASIGLLKAGMKLRSMWRRQEEDAAIAAKLREEDELLSQARLQSTPDDVWRSLEGPRGLWAMYGRARVMLDVAYKSGVEHEGVDVLLVKAIRSQAMQVRVCILTSLCQYVFDRSSEGARLNGFRAAQVFKALTPNFEALLCTNNERHRELGKGK